MHLSGLGRDHLPAAPLGPSLRSSPEPDFVSFPPSSQPQEASRSFLSGSGAGSPILTCARTVGGGREALPQWQPAASSQEALRRQGRRGGPGVGRGEGGAAVAGDRSPRPGQGPAPLLHLPSSSPLHPISPGLPGAGQEGVHCLTPSSIDVKAEDPLISLLVSSILAPSLGGGGVGAGPSRNGTLWMCTGGPCAPSFPGVEAVNTCNVGCEASRHTGP